MTFLAIIFATLGILAFCGFCIWLGRHTVFRPPLEDPPPVSWIARMEGE